MCESFVETAETGLIIVTGAPAVTQNIRELSLGCLMGGNPIPSQTLLNVTDICFSWDRE